MQARKQDTLPLLSKELGVRIVVHDPRSIPWRRAGQHSPWRHGFHQPRVLGAQQVGAAVGNVRRRWASSPATTLVPTSSLHAQGLV
ncbi:hypothetical protein AVEN_138986-1 [Araneus ventricosus]|uniref:Uncharacterized protein n=1 Tax=Araneus ventricosus TaxID=182803 RepID=A0A4Y2SYF0_ARAVE|nr:hypothetical protein AVEN_138986-1 [Araneus ventricosus]